MSARRKQRLSGPCGSASVRPRTIPLVAGLYFLMSIWAVGAAMAAEQTNLVENHGFEDASSTAWIPNNWYTRPDGKKNEATFTLDTENPHSGKYCQKINIQRIIGMPVNFLHPLPGLKSTELYELRFWVRGMINTTEPIVVYLRKKSSPWSDYSPWVGISFTEDWNEHVVRWVPPPGADLNDCEIVFGFANEGVFWIDDVSLIAMPAVEGGEPLQGNQVANGSFEAGRDRWSAQIREWFGYRWFPEAYEKNIDANIVAIEQANAPQGKKVLHFKNLGHSRTELTSAFFRLRYGRPFVVSFWMKTTPGAVVSL